MGVAVLCCLLRCTEFSFLLFCFPNVVMLSLLIGFALITDNDPKNQEYNPHQLDLVLVCINCVAVVVLLVSCIGLVPCVRRRFEKRAHQKQLATKTKQDEEDYPKNTHVVPINVGEDNSNDVDNDHDFSYEASKKHRRRTMSHSSETVATAHAIHEEFHESEHALQKEQRKKQQRQRRSTQLRVMARLKIRKTNSLTKVPLFKNCSAEAIESILELTAYKKVPNGTCLCRQGELANDFYIIVSGRCGVRVHVEGDWNSDSNRRAQRGEDAEEAEETEETEETNEEKEEQEESAKDGAPRRVGTLKDLDFFGESALLGAHKDKGQPKRNATVAVESDYVQLLMLSRANFELLVEEGVLSTDVVTKVAQENRRRSELNMKNEKKNTMDDFAVPQPTTTVPPAIRSTEAATNKGGSGGDGKAKNKRQTVVTVDRRGRTREVTVFNLKQQKIMEEYFKSSGVGATKKGGGGGGKGNGAKKGDSGVPLPPPTPPPGKGVML